MRMPTQGAQVLDARTVVGTNDAHPTHCRLLAIIKPVDPAAPNIRFELALPARWNQKILMLGGGGFDGSIPDVTAASLGGNGPNGPIPTPLQRGYAVFGSDSGHQASNPAVPIPDVDGAFLMNDEALNNYAGDALIKTHDAASFLIEKHFGQRPQRTYFRGGSNGGREAFAFIQRWPDELDGAVALFPFWNGGTTALKMGVLARALAAPGGHLEEAQMTRLYESVMQACDGLDGISDGLISNVTDCQFDPGTLLCAGQSPADGCLTRAQLETLEAFATESRFPLRAAHGEIAYPGFPILAGADLRPWFAGTQQPASPLALSMATTVHFWDQLVRFGITRDPEFDSLALDPAEPGAHAERLNAVVNMLDVGSTDLSAFQVRGGKLIVYHGLADIVLSHRATAEYWDRLVSTMGAETVDTFARYYEVPGQGHGVGVFQPVWDDLGALDRWVEAGKPPVEPMVRDGANDSGRVRPLCRYGTWPQYRGSGDSNAGASFSCVDEGRDRTIQADRSRNQ